MRSVTLARRYLVVPVGTNTHRRITNTAIGLGIAVLAVAGFSPTVPPAPASLAADDTEFSAERAMTHVEAIAREPHPMGTARIEQVRRYIVEEARSLGLEVELQAVAAPNYFGNGEPVDVVNVIAWIPGTANTKAVVLMAHYDTVPTTPGANDNSAAVAALLETARALQAGPTPANDIVFLFTDGEEPAGRYGSSAFAASDVLAELGIVVNFEAIGGSGASLLAETNGPERWLVERYAATDPGPAAFSFMTELTRMIGKIGTDFDVFAEAGLPGMHFAYVRGSPIYHTPADDIASVSRSSVQHHGSHALSIARHFGELDLSALPESGRAVFFTVGTIFIAYPTAWALPLALLLVAGLVLAVLLLRRRQQLAATPRQVVASTGVALLAVVVAAIAGTIVWVSLGAMRSSRGVPESYGYMVVALAVAAATGAWVTRRFDRADATQPQAWITLWVLLALVTTAAPGFSYLFPWPAVAAMAGFIWRPRTRAAAVARFFMVAIPALLLMIPAVDTLFLLAQPRPGNPDSEITAVAFAPLMLAMLVGGLLTCGWQHPESTRATTG
jgi:hypothetical protein